MSHDQHSDQAEHTMARFEPDAWDERYSGSGNIWSGQANPQLLALATTLTPGTALDVGCGEGGDVIWLAQQGWTATGADFSAQALARAATNAEAAGVAERCDWWQVDARTFDITDKPGTQAYDLVTCHYLHPPNGGMPAVLARLVTALTPGGHLLVVGHAPSPVFGLHAEHRQAMFNAAELLVGLPEGFEVLACEDRPRHVVRDGHEHDVEDATLVLRRHLS